MKRFYFGWAYDELKGELVLVRTDSDGKNLSQKESIPTTYCDRWVMVKSETAAQAKEKVLRGEGFRFS